jgi:hypothetical protein
VQSRFLRIPVDRIVPRPTVGRLVTLALLIAAFALADIGSGGAAPDNRTGCAPAGPLSVSSGTGKYRIEVETDKAAWQPFSGEFLIDIIGDDLNFTKFDTTFCWPYDKKGSSGSASEGLNLHLVERDVGKLVLGVTVPRGIFEANRPSTLGMLWGGLLGKAHNPGDGWSLVPRADLHIVGTNANADLSFDIVRAVGITSRAKAAFLALIGVLFGWWILLDLGESRGIAGDAILRVLANRDGYASLSQLQLLLWTFVIGAGTIYVMALTGALIDIPQQTLGLLGIAGVAGLGAQVAQAMPGTDDTATDDAAKSDAPPVATTAGLTARTPQWSDLVIVDGHGEIDVTRVQMLFFTGIAALFVALKIGNDSMIPEIPQGIMLLMSLSNGVYLTAKFLPGGR